MDTGILHTHHLVVGLYLLYVLIIAFFIITQKKNAVTTIRGKFKFIRIGIEVLMLLTGGYLMFKAPLGLSLITYAKIGGLVISVVLLIIAQKRMSAPLAILSLALLLYVYMFAKKRDLMLSPEEMRVHNAFLQGSNPTEKGKMIYEVACERCHGQTGEAQYRKAKNLKTSTLDAQGQAAFIKAGAGAMPGYDYLTQDEMNALSEYLQSLKQNESK